MLADAPSAQWPKDGPRSANRPRSPRPWRTAGYLRIADVRGGIFVGRNPPIAAVGARYRVETCGVAKLPGTADVDEVEGATVQFRVQFLDVSAAVIKEMHIDAHSVAGAIELVAGLDWPTGAVRIVILDEVGSAVHSEWK